MKIGINSFTWTSPFRTERVDLIAKAKEIGFDVFEMAVEEPQLIDLEVVKRAYEENEIGATLCAVVGPGRDLSHEDAQVRETTKAYLRWCIDAAAKIGSPVVSGPLYSSVGKARWIPEGERRQERARAVQGLREMASYAGDRGVRLALEPLNRFEIDMINTVDQALELIEEIGSPHVGLMLDSFHMHIEEKNSKEAILRAGSRVFNFHSNENDRGIPGSGQVNWRGIIEGLREIGYQGSLVIESFTPELEAIARAVCLWRPIAPSQDAIAIEGLRFLRRLIQEAD